MKVVVDRGLKSLLFVRGTRWRLMRRTCSVTEGIWTNQPKSPPAGTTGRHPPSTGTGVMRLSVRRGRRIPKDPERNVAGSGVVP